MLVRLDNLEEWKGERLNGVAHPRNIEKLWSDDELAAIGLSRLEQLSVPEGKMVDGAVTRALRNGKVVEEATIVAIPEPTQDEIDEVQDRQLDLLRPPYYVVLFDLLNEVRALKGEKSLTPQEFRAYLKARL